MLPRSCRGAGDRPAAHDSDGTRYEAVGTNCLPICRKRYDRCELREGLIRVDNECIFCHPVSRLWPGWTAKPHEAAASWASFMTSNLATSYRPKPILRPSPIPA